MTPASRTILTRSSTATLATLLFKRGLRNQFVQGVGPVRPMAMSMVGPAFTLRYIPAREDLNGIEVFRDPNHPQRRAVEEIPEGHVLVMDCRQDATAASAGSILLTRLEVRGAAGVVTDGGLRDVAGIAALSLPAYCARPSAPTNLTRHHAIDTNVPIGCGGVAVFPGDIVVGDNDGILVLPAHLVDDIAADAEHMEHEEAWILDQVRSGTPLPGLYPMNAATRQRFEAETGRSQHAAGTPAGPTADALHRR